MCKVITEVTWITVPTQNIEKFSPHFEHVCNYHSPKYLSETKSFYRILNMNTFYLLSKVILKPERKILCGQRKKRTNNLIRLMHDIQIIHR
jgi:hypothetical protein